MRQKLLLPLVFVLTSLAYAQRVSATEFIVNGGFESGAFAPGWTINETNPTPTISNTVHHSGGFSAFLGDAAPPESNGNCSIFSNLTAVLPGNAMLSFWFSGETTDSITFDWQDAYVVNAAGTILATIMHVCTTTVGFQQVMFDMSAFSGQQVQIGFLVHEDGFGDVTNMNVDDVSIQGVPEPSAASLGLLGAGVLVAAGVVRRMRHARA